MHLIGLFKYKQCILVKNNINAFLTDCWHCIFFLISNIIKVYNGELKQKLNFFMLKIEHYILYLILLSQILKLKKKNKFNLIQLINHNKINPRVLIILKQIISVTYKNYIVNIKNYIYFINIKIFEYNSCNNKYLFYFDSHLKKKKKNERKYSHLCQMYLNQRVKVKLYLYTFFLNLEQREIIVSNENIFSRKIYSGIV